MAISLSRRSVLHLVPLDIIVITAIAVAVVVVVIIIIIISSSSVSLIDVSFMLAFDIFVFGTLSTVTVFRRYILLVALYEGKSKSLCPYFKCSKYL
jgi:steroid 5-alpha reductase family enzyme